MIILYIKMSRIGFRSQFCNNSINVLRTQQICSQVTLTDGQVYIKSAVKKLTQYTSKRKPWQPQTSLSSSYLFSSCILPLLTLLTLLIWFDFRFNHVNDISTYPHLTYPSAFCYLCLFGCPCLCCLSQLPRNGKKSPKS